jgi:hypothetical protein
MGTGPEELFGAGLWSEHAAKAMRQPGGFVLQRRHKDRTSWVTIRSFASKSEAESALDALIKDGKDAAAYRIRKEGQAVPGYQLPRVGPAYLDPPR